MTATRTAPALSVRDLTVTYADGYTALDGVDLEVPAGERWAVVGRSGSGKTTLVRAVLGLLPPGTTVTGSIRLDGRELLGLPEPQLRELRGRAIGYVPQDPYAACDPLRTVGHHVAEAWWTHRLTPPPGRIAADLGGVGIDDAARRAAGHPHTWSGGMLQRATIVAGTAHSPPLTLADEPSSALDAELADDVLRLVRERSGALLLVSHDLTLVARHADHVLVLADGRVAERGPAATLLSAPCAPSTHELLDAHAPALRRTSTGTPGPILLRARDLVRRYGDVTAVDGASVTLRAGEVLGVVGRSGSGKSTLARLLAGMERPDAGSVVIGDGGRSRPGFVMPVFQDPVASLDRRWPLWRTLTEPLRARGERVRRADARQAAASMLARVGLAGIDPDRRPATLSVGQAQRVAIARALAARPGLLVADEPTASLDVVTAAAITTLLRELADNGTALVVVTHDRQRIAGYADRLLTMSDGRAEELRLVDTSAADD
ncbi:ABC transporter ATP-binding protein [Pseudonocardia parietis]|uniref:Peptide/nickel transport system ATP-binding protein n=1 Tax=Pseudonocardia parietis TaxID=570936 RepID=A0ABS4VYH8_9PSEU|nr:ATP-binding cassette domain-containing protein [Pseudonocardia parietis]MBP2369013.1 peptide/nickel transport system ATP-binding protein [Pseudonocardia parietis]